MSTNNLLILNYTLETLCAATQSIAGEISSADTVKCRDCCLRAQAFMQLLTNSPQLECDNLQQILNTINCSIQIFVQILSKQSNSKASTTALLHNQIPISTDSSIAISSGVKFDDIVGNCSAKQQLFENIVLPFTLSEKAKKSIFTGIRSTAGNVLLFGPPGCGKTLMVQAAAHEAQATLLAVRPSDILSKYQGESERYIRNLFDDKVHMGKRIIFFDEFDSVAIARGGADDNALSRRLLSEILLQLSHHKSRIQKHGQYETDDDESSESANLIVIAATNRMEDLDEAVVRRFDSKVYVGPPDATDRKALLAKFMQQISSTLTTEECSRIGEHMDGWSGSDVESLCREAAMIPLREVFHYSSPQHHSHASVVEKSVRGHPIADLRAVQYSDFDLAFANLLKWAGDKLTVDGC